MGYCIYLRKSRADMEAESYGEGETLAKHETILLGLAESQKLHITEIYKEVVSGETISSRPVMQKLLNDVEQGLWQGVLVMEIERLARGDTVDQGIVAQAFKFSNTKIITPKKNYDPNNEYDEEYFEFGLFMSRREYKTINRRLQSGRLVSVKEGKYLGNTPPYGYDRVKLSNQKGFSLEPNPAEADIVKYIFDLYVNGEECADGSHKRLGVSRIVRKLNDLKLPARNGGDWVPGTIQGILKNPVYIGKIRWNARKMVKKVIDGRIEKQRPRAKAEDITICEGIHPPIVDIGIWESAQYIINKNRRPASAKRVMNPLAGIVICGKCGRRMIRRPYTNRPYSDTLMCPVTSCDNISSRLDLVETRIIESLGDWLCEYKLVVNNEKNKVKRTVDIREKAIERLNLESVKLNKQIESLHDLLEQGVYTSEKFFERSKMLGEKLDKVNLDIESLQKQFQNECHTEKTKVEVIPQIQYILDIYYTIENPETKNALLKGIIEKAIYIKIKGGRWHSDPADFKIILVPKGF